MSWEFKRRARALEDVLLPETQEAIRNLEQEEVIRARLKGVIG